MSSMTAATGGQCRFDVLSKSQHGRNDRKAEGSEQE